MYIDLCEILMFINNDDLENDIDSILEKNNIDHYGYNLFNENSSLIITDPEGNKYLEIPYTREKRSYLYIDIINILLQFYIMRKEYQQKKSSRYNINNIETYDFIKRCCNIILKKTHFYLFEFIDLNYDNKDHMPYIEFKLYKNNYIISIHKKKILKEEFYTIRLEIEINENEKKYLDLIKSKPLKVYGNLCIDLLYQLVLYVYHYINFIEGNSNWDLL